MKNFGLIFLLSIITLSAFGQAGSLSQSVYRSRVNDSTTVNGAHASGYGDFYWNNQDTNPGWRVWNGTSYDIGFSAGGNFWKNAGTTTLTGMPIIDGATNDLSFENIGNFSTETLSEIYFGPGTDFRVSATEKASITATDSINFTAPIIKLGGQVGTTGQVPTINASGVLKYATPSGSGGTPGGADTNVQYNDGGAFGGEAAYAYDDGTNTLTVDNIATPYTALTDGAAITITGSNHTLTSTQATVTWTLSQTGNYSEVWITLNATTSTYTFPAGALCVSEGLLTGNNVVTINGTSGDQYVLAISKNGSNYKVILKNFGQ